MSTTHAYEKKSMENSDINEGDIVIDVSKRKACKTSNSLLYCLVITILVLLLVVIAFLSIIWYSNGFSADEFEAGSKKCDKEECMQEFDYKDLMDSDDLLQFQRDTFKSLDFDGDNKLDFAQFTSFVSIVIELGSLFDHLSALNSNNMSVITVETYAILFSAKCFDASFDTQLQACKSWAQNTGVCTGIIDLESEHDLRLCVELIAYDFVMHTTGDSYSLDISRAEYIENMALKAFKNIKNANGVTVIDYSEPVTLNELIIMQHQQKNEEMNVYPWTVGDYEIDFNRTPMPMELTPTSPQVEQLRQKREESTKRRLLECSPDCDWYDYMACEGSLVASCILGGPGGCLAYILVGAFYGGPCYETQQCLRHCQCTLSCASFWCNLSCSYGADDCAVCT